MAITDGLNALTLKYADIEARYKIETPATHRRQFGQFFTPEPIAELMCDWVLEKGPKTLLDPAVGPGIFPATVLRRDSNIRITAIDLDEQVLKYAEAAFQCGSVELLNDDFLHLQSEEHFDAIIANPPYLRHHDFDYADDIFADIGKRNQVKLSKLTNIYALFVFEICRRLKSGGRAAVIIPTEWTNANFGVALKHFLLGNNLLRKFIYFTHESLPFADALTTACVLLIEKPVGDEVAEPVTTMYLNQEVDLELIRGVMSGKITKALPNSVVVKQFPRDFLSSERKWDHILQHESVSDIPGLVPLRQLARTRRGIATGANEFFHVSYDDGIASQIQEKHLSPCIGRAADIKGVSFEASDFTSLVSSRKRTHLVNIGAPNEAEERFLLSGVAMGLTQRYLLASRTKWYAMEQRPASPIWAAVFGRTGLRFVRNHANAQNLTTFHCIYPFNSDATTADALTVCLNSQFIQGRSRRQHRVYGGGLLKVEPKDLLDIEVPDLANVSRATVEELARHLSIMDAEIRSGGLSEHSAAQIEEAVARAVSEAGKSA